MWGPSCSAPTDRQTNVTKLIIAFRNLVNRPHKNCGTHRTSVYTDIPSRTFLTTKEPPSFVNHRTLGPTLWIFFFSRKFDQVNQYLGARLQFYKRFLLEHFPYLRFIHAWISDILPVIFAPSCRSNMSFSRQVTAQICSFRAGLLFKSVLFAPGYCSNLFFSRRVTAQICSFPASLLLRSVLFALGYCSDLFFRASLLIRSVLFPPGYCSNLFFSR